MWRNSADWGQCVDDSCCFIYRLRLEPTVIPLVPSASPHRTTHSSGFFLFIPFWRHWKALKPFLPWKLWGASQQVLVTGSLLHVCKVCLMERPYQMSISLPRIILITLQGVWKCWINVTTSQNPVRHDKTSKELKHFQDPCLFPSLICMSNHK